MRFYQKSLIIALAMNLQGCLVDKAYQSDTSKPTEIDLPSNEPSVYSKIYDFNLDEEKNEGFSNFAINIDLIKEELLSKAETEKILISLKTRGNFVAESLTWRLNHPNIDLLIDGQNQSNFDSQGHPCYSEGCNYETPCSQISNSSTKAACISKGYGTYFLTVAVGSYLNYTNLNFGRVIIKNLSMKNYWRGITLHGSPEQRIKFPEIRNVDFQNIGNKHNPAWKAAFAAVSVREADFGVFENNTFKDILNSGTEDERYLIHAYYFVRASDHLISGNVIDHVSGHPIKFRDFSNRNYVTESTIIAGSDSLGTAIQDYYAKWWLGDTANCTGANPNSCIPIELRERGSFSNVVYGNSYAGYDGENLILTNNAAPLERTITCPRYPDQYYLSYTTALSLETRMIYEGKSYKCFPGRNSGSETDFINRFDITNGLERFDPRVIPENK